MLALFAKVLQFPRGVKIRITPLGDGKTRGFSTEALHLGGINETLSDKLIAFGDSEDIHTHVAIEPSLENTPPQT